jgi:hypothetical protein
MRGRIRGVAVLTCALVVVTGAFTAAAVTSAAATRAAVPAADALLSQGKPVTASSSGGCCAAKNVNDGKTSTRWASAAGKDPSWVYVDLGATAHVSRVRLIWDASCATAYRVETSPDHNTWTQIFTTNAGNGGTDDLTGLSGDGQFVRVFGTKRCRADAAHGYSLQEFEVYGTTGGTNPPPPPPPPGPPPPPPPPGGNPYGDPNLVSMFNGTNLDGWTQSRPDGWVVQNGAIHGTGAGRGWIYYKQQAGTFRWIFNVRQVTGNHAPTVLIWGTTNPIRDALSAIQFQPPNGGHWDYRPGHNNGGGKLFKQLPHTKIDVHQWAQCELIANQTTGVARMACCPLTGTEKTCKATEVLDFTDKTAARVGPLAIQIHNSGINDEYRSLFMESPVVDSPDQFITTK